MIFDAMVAQLEFDFPAPGGGPVGGKGKVDMVIADLAVGYKVNDNFDLYAGVRYYDQDIGVTPDMMPKVSIGDDWTDFVLGFRVHNSMSEK